MNISAANQTKIIKLATDANFFGKKLRNKKLEVCDGISREVFGTAKHSSEICDWLEANRPVKPATAKRERIAKEDNRPLTAGALNSAVETWKVKQGKRFLLTSAQNNTDVHANFLQTLEVAAKHLNAELLVSKFLYNKNGFQNGEGAKGIHFDPRLEKYFLTENVFLNSRESNFAFMAEINILPTATFPLSGFAETAVAFGLDGLAIGHAKISAESVAALKGETVRRMYSTGTVTTKNYIQQKAGQKAEALHNYGALLVEFDDNGVFYVRQIESMDASGAFYDLTDLYTVDGVKHGQNVLGLQYGDIHAEKIDEDCAAASWGVGGLVDVLKPKYQLIHDVHDFTSRNHHNRNSGVFLASQYAQGRDKVLQDIKDTGEILQNMEREFSQTVVIESNHDLALARWLDDPKCNVKQDPANAALYYKLNAALYAAIESGDETFNVLSYAIQEVAGYDVAAIFLETDQSLKLAGIECGMHGHNGINGARGNPKGFMKLGKANTGHTHTASIYGGVYTAGVAGSLDMGYNIGASSWSQTHIITYPNGQRTLIDFKAGKFYA